MNIDQVTLVGQVFESYVSEYHKNDILLILKERDEDAHYPVVVNAMTLFETNMEIGEYFNVFPNEVLTIFDSALQRSALTILQSLSQPEGVSMKQNLHARISAPQYIVVYSSLWVLLVVACGTPPQRSLMSSAMSAPRIRTNETLGRLQWSART
uniref:Minichromosome maintenance 9 homologous recombination repair factor n=1 Tax=Equus asinus TaxID=9793 RepID=A0A9L0J706_EQUAS